MMMLCCKRVVSPGKDSEQQTNLPPEPLSSLGSSIKTQRSFPPFLRGSLVVHSGHKDMAAPDLVTQSRRPSDPGQIVRSTGR